MRARKNPLPEKARTQETGQDDLLDQTHRSCKNIPEEFERKSFFYGFCILNRWALPLKEGF